MLAGERYRIRTKGYRTGANPVYLLIRTTIGSTTTDLGWPGASLPEGAVNEAWIEQVVTIPAGANITLQAGVTWNTVTANQTFHLNEFSVERLSTAAPEYQYFLKDHLGNVRVTFTTKDEAISYTATLEDNSQATEQANFKNYSRVTNDLFDHTDAGTTYNKVHLLNGGNNLQVGLAKSIAVMPGDVISASVFARYYAATGSGTSLSTFAAALLSAFGLPTPVVGEVGTASVALQNYGNFIFGGGNPGNSSWPKGFLNVLVFDRDYNLIDAGYQQLDAAFVQAVGSSTKGPHQQLAVNLTIREPGYVYIYLSNEGNVQRDIYFDDMTVTHTKSKVVQVNDYYPFGLTFNSYSRENSVENRYQVTGKEIQNELGLRWNDFGARMYMSEIGIWMTKDPHSENYMNMSPFSYCVANPVNFVDPDGKDVIFNITRDRGGNITGVTLSATVYITGVGATQERADELNKAVPSVFKSRKVNGVNISFNIKYKYAASISKKDLTQGDNVLNFVNVPSTRDDRSKVPGAMIERTNSDGLIQRTYFSGRFGEIKSDNWDKNRTIFHETLHFMGLEDRYYEDEQESWEGFENDIMGANRSTKIGYDHYEAYYRRGTDPTITQKYRRGFLNKTMVDRDANGSLIPPSDRQKAEQNE